MSRKQERIQKAAEDKILQFKAVVEYLSKKKDVSEIPLSNQACIVDVLRQGGWKPDGVMFVKGDQRLDLIEAGKAEFKDQYSRLRAEHLRTTVKNLMEG
jgi:hypothetical protein